MGEMLEGVPRGRRKKSLPDGRISLASVGVTEKQSHHWQREAGVPEPTFERFVAEECPPFAATDVGTEELPADDMPPT